MSARSSLGRLLVCLLLLIVIIPDSDSLAFSPSSASVPLKNLLQHHHRRLSLSSRTHTSSPSPSPSSPTCLHARKTKDTKTKLKSNANAKSSKRRTSLSSLQTWAQDAAGIQTSPAVVLKDDVDSGRGWFTTSSSSGQGGVDAGGALLLTVPSTVALTVECPGTGPDDSSIRRMLGPNGRQVLNQLPWYVQMALYVYKLDKVDSTKEQGGGIDMRPWLDSLPQPSDFNTPIHWTDSQRSELQYAYMKESVNLQEQKWKKYYDTVQSALSSSQSSSSSSQQQSLSYDTFVWACECARSRAFSSSYTGSAFNPLVYAFTLVLVAVYVGLGLGTLEQAANGAGVVFSAAVLKDFVLPKLFSNKSRRYVLGPLLDMANHNSKAVSAQVSLEYFQNAYSLAATAPVTTSDSQIFISYGDRSNDQLLQYYGFVETNNPHDVYILPPLREWDIAALEKTVASNFANRGTSFAAGRLEKLDRAGLLGVSTSIAEDNDLDSDTDDEKANQAGGVVLTRQGGMDPAVIQALRALVSTESEWTEAGEAVGNFCEFFSTENEQAARLVAKTAVEMELASKPTTLQQDQALLQKMQTAGSKSSLVDADAADVLAVQFRIEKKKLLQETIDKLR